MNLRIGITGGIGSGKSYICAEFAALGIPIYSADTRAKWLMQNNEALKEQLIKQFGVQVFDNGVLDRQYLAAKVFHNKSELSALNAIVHPAVAIDFEQWNAVQNNAPYTIKEAALMFETDMHKQMDKTILVHAPIDVRILRVMKRDGVSQEQVEARMRNQMSDDDKMSLADYIINNDGDREVEKVVVKLNALFSMSALSI